MMLAELLLGVSSNVLLLFISLLPCYATIRMKLCFRMLAHSM